MLYFVDARDDRTVQPRRMCKKYLQNIRLRRKRNAAALCDDKRVFIKARFNRIREDKKENDIQPNQKKEL
jgi:hypothetical protein